MINETIILLLARLEDSSEHKLSKYVSDYAEVSALFKIYFREPLQEVFSKVVPYDYTKRMSEIGVKGVQEEVIELVRKEHAKYVLWLTAAYEFQESTFDKIREEGSTVVGWFFDDEWRFDNYSKWWSPHLDYCVTYDIEAVPKYEALGARVIQSLPCEGIPVDLDWSNIEEKYDVTFVGSTKSKPGREQYINVLKNRNIPVCLFGEAGGWYVTLEEMMDIFATSKINLNFSRATDSERMGAKGRVFFVCLAGGFLLTEYAPGIENYFEIDKEIVCFTGAEEMVEKVTYYLNHDEERRAIAQAGWKRAINEYTPFHMLSRVVDEIEKDIAVKNKENNIEGLKMPRWMRKSPSQYYFRWGRAFLESNCEGLWKDALALSLSYNPFNIGARYYYIVGLFPSFARSPFFKLYKPYQAAEKLYMSLRNRLLYWADSIPYVKEMKRSVARRLYPT